MAGRVVAELIRKRTRRGDGSYFVGTAGDVRISLFYTEAQTHDAGEAVEVWELRAEPLFPPAGMRSPRPRTGALAPRGTATAR
jgi:hypothetical protein